MQLPPDRGTPGTKIEGGLCLLCGEPLKDGGWCDRCQMSRSTIERIFRAERLEEARSPCAVFVFLALVSLLIAVGLILWAVFGG
jgi:hypothetical protein